VNCAPVPSNNPHPHPSPASGRGDSARSPAGGRWDNARFITFEGIDGAGKSTLLESLVRALAARGIAHVQTREPGGTTLGESLRGLLLRESMSALTETLLMFAARAEHVRAVIVPALEAGKWVVCDRFLDASYAYQGGGRGVARETIDELARWSVPAQVQADLTVLVDIDPQLAQQRLAQARAGDRFEEESSVFFASVRAAYLQRAQDDPGRFLLVDGTRPPGELSTLVWERLAPWLT